MIKNKYFLPGIVLLLIAAASSLSALAGQEESYQIGKEDVLDISVWQSPDLTKAVTVDANGSITYPILGSIPVLGITPAQLEKTITQKLSEGYVKDPKVTVGIKEYNSKKILVFGEVVKPGLYKLKGKIPLLELLFLVGGVREDAKRMTVIRPPEAGMDPTPTALTPEESDSISVAEIDESPKPVEVDLIALLSRGDLSQNIFILPGDTIYVSSGTGEKFYVLGQVKKPGPYEWVQKITVLEAVKAANGPTEKAAMNRIVVKKNSANGSESVKVNVNEIMQGKRKDDVMINSGDVVVVPESWV